MMLVPCNAKKLWIYNFVTCTWKGLALDDFVDPNMEAKFVGGALKMEWHIYMDSNTKAY